MSRSVAEVVGRKRRRFSWQPANGHQCCTYTVTFGVGVCDWLVAAAHEPRHDDPRMGSRALAYRQVASLVVLSRAGVLSGHPDGTRSRTAIVHGSVRLPAARAETSQPDASTLYRCCVAVCGVFKNLLSEGCIQQQYLYTVHIVF